MNVTFTPRAAVGSVVGLRSAPHAGADLRTAPAAVGAVRPAVAAVFGVAAPSVAVPLTALDGTRLTSFSGLYLTAIP